MASHILSSLETTLILSVAALYIVHCPFNKVEESFNTQAIHDIVNIFPDRLPSQSLQAIDSSQQELAVRSQLPWDHVLFPGVVPRTFIGALIVGIPMKLAKYFMSTGLLTDDNEEESEPDLTSQFVLQIGSRFALSSFVVLSLSAVTRALHKRFIPNTFAAILTNLILASWINRHYSKSVIYIAFCVLVFRFDTSIFFGCLLFDGVFIRKFLSLGRVLKIGIPAGLCSIMISFAIDSTFWARPVWPELEGLYFNLWLNKSHEWGTQPYLWYIYSCLPRIMMASAPLILLADHKITRDYLIPTLAFIFIYSFLPHKELRFVLFVTPYLNICAASGLMNVYFYLKKLFLYLRTRYLATFLFILVLAGMFSANIFASFVLSRISSHNYPGGQAAISLGMTKELLDTAQKSMNSGAGGIHDPRSDAAVYVNNLAAQTGVSRFVQVNGVYYAKTPKLDGETFKKSYSLIYLILEPKEVVSYLRDFCPIEKNQEQLFEQGVDKWRRSNNEIKCSLPNQSQMYCSIIDTVNSFKSVNIGGLIRRLKEINSLHVVAGSLDDAGFIKTRTALHVVRCSTRSKFNPFS